jgi:hypothetical protein
MQIERQHAVGAGLGDQIGDQLGGDRRAAGHAAVLAGIAEIGQHRGDAPGRGSAERIDHDEQFHQVIVGRKGGRLQDEDVLAAHVFLNLDENLLVGEAADTGLAQRHVEIEDRKPAISGFRRQLSRQWRYRVHRGADDRHEAYAAADLARGKRGGGWRRRRCRLRRFRA